MNSQKNSQSDFTKEFTKRYRNKNQEEILQTNPQNDFSNKKHIEISLPAGVDGSFTVKSVRLFDGTIPEGPFTGWCAQFNSPCRTTKRASLGGAAWLQARVRLAHCITEHPPAMGVFHQ